MFVALSNPTARLSDMRRVRQSVRLSVCHTLVLTKPLTVGLLDFYRPVTRDCNF